LETLILNGNTNFNDGIEILRDVSVQRLFKLREINLQNCNQKRLETKSLEWVLPSIRKIEFSGNPIVCDCGKDEQGVLDLPSSRSGSRSFPVSIPDRQNLTCSNDRFKNKKVSSLENFDFGYCQGKTHLSSLNPSENFVIRKNTSMVELSVPDSVTKFKGGIFLTYHKIRNYESKPVKFSKSDLYQVPENFENQSRNSESIILNDLDNDSEYLVCFVEKMDEEGRPMLNRCTNVVTTKTKYKLMGKFGITIFSILLAILGMVVITTIGSGIYVWRKNGELLPDGRAGEVTVSGAL